LLALVVFSSGLASAVTLNDTVCLLGTPLLLEITERARIPAVPFHLALATSSNIGSAMTLAGTPQNIRAADSAKIYLSFNSLWLLLYP
jgi:Na+/H+ antiporter NhaD/arsenite permease-like protein